MVSIVLRLADEGGANIARICQKCGIGSFNRYKRYRDTYPEFREAVEQCLMAKAAAMCDAVDEAAMGEKKIDFKAAQWALWNSNQEMFPLSPKQDALTVNNIKIGNLNVANINKLSGPELDSLIEQLETSVASIQESQLPKIETHLKPEGETIDVNPDD
jgi:hypothetical protein